MITCRLNGIQAQMLLDSGAQVSIIGREWLRKNLPTVQIQSLETLIADKQLNVTAANGTAVPFEGWIEILLEITSAKHGSIAIYVPMLVGQEVVDCPLLGFNVIEEIIRENDTVSEIHLTDLLSEAMNLQRDRTETLVSAVTSDTHRKALTSPVVKTGKVGIIIQRGQITNVRCRLKAWPKGGTMMFEPCMGNSVPEGLELFSAIVNVPRGASKIVKIPIQNIISQDIYLPGRLTLGTIEPIMGTKPVQLGSNVSDNEKQNSDASLCSIQTLCLDKHCQEKDEREKKRWHPPVELDHLEEQEREIVKQMLFEESDVFACDEGDIGCIPGLQLKINLTDKTPVQRCYNAIPKPLYREVKDYVRNLLEKGWIAKSAS